MKLNARNVLEDRRGEERRNDGSRANRPDGRRGDHVLDHNEAVDDLNLAVGDDAYAVIKASDVMIGRD